MNRIHSDMKSWYPQPWEKIASGKYGHIFQTNVHRVPLVLKIVLFHSKIVPCHDPKHKNKEKNVLSWDIVRDGHPLTNKKPAMSIRDGKLFMEKYLHEPDPHWAEYAFVREAWCMEQMDHLYVNQWLSVHMRTGYGILVMQPMLCSFYTMIYNAKRSLSSAMVKQTMYQLIQGICHAHDNQVMHRDLKPENLLVSPERKNIKIADWCMSHHGNWDRVPSSVRSLLESNTVSPAQTPGVTPIAYRAPEILLGHAYSFGIDCWSIGCIFGKWLRASYYLAVPCIILNK